VVANLKIDPRFNGPLNITVFNVGPGHVTLTPRDGVLHRLLHSP
jgi:hypothetical protein